MERTEIKMGDKTVKVAEETVIELIGQISQKDIDDGTVLIFRIDDSKYPPAAINQLVESIRQAVIDNFQGQLKAMILPQSVEVQVLRDILTDAVKKGEESE